MITISIHDQILDIKTELTKLFRENGVVSINYGDIYTIAPRYPAIDILLMERKQNNLQVLQKNKIGWDLFYDISCMFTGSEHAHTFINSSKFVDTIYDKIQGTKDGRLNESIYDLECIEVKYGLRMLNFKKAYSLGKASVREDVMTSGGVIKLVIQLFEER